MPAYASNREANKTLLPCLSRACRGKEDRAGVVGVLVEIRNHHYAKLRYK